MINYLVNLTIDSLTGCLSGFWSRVGEMRCNGRVEGEVISAYFAHAN